MKECWKTTTTVKNVGKHKKIFQQNDINVSLLLSSCKSLLREYKQPKDWNIKKKMLKEIMVSLLNDNKQKKQYEATYTTKTFINIIPWRVVTWTFWRKESFIHLKNVYYNITYINTNTCSKGIYMYLKKIQHSLLSSFQTSWWGMFCASSSWSPPTKKYSLR